MWQVPTTSTAHIMIWFTIGELMQCQHYSHCSHVSSLYRSLLLAFCWYLTASAFRSLLLAVCCLLPLFSLTVFSLLLSAWLLRKHYGRTFLQFLEGITLVIRDNIQNMTVHFILHWVMQTTSQSALGLNSVNTASHDSKLNIILSVYVILDGDVCYMSAFCYLLFCYIFIAQCNGYMWLALRIPISHLTDYWSWLREIV